MHAHVEELLRANDTQRHALEELGNMLGFPMRTKSGVPRKPALLHHSSSSSSEGQERYMQQTMNESMNQKDAYGMIIIRRRRSADEIMLTMASFTGERKSSFHGK